MQYQNPTKQTFSVFTHLLLPLWGFVFLTWIGITPINMYLAKLCYLGDGTWLAHGSVFFETVLHQWGKFVPAVVASVVLILWAASFRPRAETLRPYRATFLYIALCIALCTLAVVLGKHFSISSCPQDLSEFGGLGLSPGHCYPAGHVGSAFCLFGLYFAARKTLKSPHRTLLLAAILALGIAFGVGRQLQGAHFLSHTLATLCLDWFLCGLLYAVTIGRDEVRTWRIYFATPILLVGAVCFFWATVYNLPFWYKALEGLSDPDARTWLVLLSCYAILLFGSAAASMLGIFPRVIRLLMVALSLLGAAGFYFSENFGTIINASMIRNVLATNYSEAAELLSPGFFAEYLFLLAPPLYLIFFARVKPVSMRRTVLVSVASLAGCAFSAVLVVFLSYQGLSSLIRGEPVLRNLITPLNIVSATAKTLTTDSDPDKKRVRKIIDANPTLEKSASDKRGTLFVVVVGETVRLANWGLAGYERNTTPELSTRGVYAFRDTEACGTSTDVSLPCMFSRVGRHNYDRKTILEEESLLPLLQRAGARVFWLDNQSGCKGVCEGVTNLKLDKTAIASLCNGGDCFDSALLVGMDSRVLDAPDKTTVVFMHQLGNHGPSYYKRYPEGFEKWKPVCTNDQLQKCTRQEIVNAYDNAILYTDSFLAGVIDWLAGMKNMDTALLYVSDHGESLGENNMYLHGAPQIMAPSEQTKVPMVLWLSDNYKKRLGLNDACLKKRVTEPASHDFLYSSLLSLLRVKSSTYNPSFDFIRPCLRTP